MILPDGTPLSVLGLSSMTVIPRGGIPRNLIAWFGPWVSIVAPISEAQRDELAQDSLLVLSLLDFDPHQPQGAGAHVHLFGVGVSAE